MTSTQTATVTATNAQELADQINARHANAESLTVGARRVKTWPGSKPATAWQNGSLSVDVAKANGQPGGTAWFKVGHVLNVTSN